MPGRRKDEGMEPMRWELEVLLRTAVECVFV